MALEKLDHVSAAFVGRGITLLVSNDDPLDEKAISSALEELKIKISGVQKAEKLPL